MTQNKFQKTFFMISLLTAFLWFYPLSGGCATIHVPGDQPTIQAGIDAAVDGDIVLVADGTYNGVGNYNLSFNGKAITVESENGAELCIIDCEKNGRGFLFLNNEGTNSILSGFTIKNGSGNDIYNGGGIYCQSSSPVIKNCIIVENDAQSGGGIGCEGASAEIQNCIIRKNSALLGGGGIYTSSSMPAITNCVIADNQNQDNLETFIGGGILCVMESSPIIRNCTISGNKHSAISCFTTSTPTIINSILWKSLPNGGEGVPQEVLVNDDSMPVVTFCDVFGGYPGEGNFHAEPIFVDVENGNYSLNPSSPCMYVGTASSSPEYDIRGIVRPQGYGYDIGAYEVVFSEQRPIIDLFSADPPKGFIPLEVYFVCTAHDPNGQIIDYTMDYGDGSLNETNSTGFFSHTYESVGEIYASCKVEDNSGAATNSIPLEIIKGYGTINVPEDYGSIQSAIDAAYDGDTVFVADGTYSGEGNKNLNFNGKKIIVRSQNGPEKCIIDCENNGRGFYFYTGESETSVVSGFTIINGMALNGAGICCLNTSPTIMNCVFQNNNASWGYSGEGGAIYAEESSLVISDCTISQNNALQDGGGICYYSSETSFSPKIINCTIFDNNAVGSGGGISSYTFSPIIISNCNIFGNTASSGGGIQGNHLIIQECTINDNRAKTSGGGVYLRSEGNALKKCIISNNIVQNEVENIEGGGGLFISMANVLIEDCEINGNQSTAKGGGIYASRSVLSSMNTLIENNSAGESGGGIFLESSQELPSFEKCVISKNRSETDGGGIYCDGCNLSKCIVKENIAVADGGGIYGKSYYIDDSSKIMNSIITKNTTNGRGGGIYFESDSVVPELTNNTIFANTAIDDGGGIYLGTASAAIIKNTIFWKNTINQIIYDLAKSKPTVSFCMIQGGYAGEGNFHGDPLFLDSENDEYSLFVSSPCIDAGTSEGAPSEDIQGDPRYIGLGNDIGAYEITYIGQRPIIDSFQSIMSDNDLPLDVTFNCSAHDPDGEIGSYTMDFGDDSPLETNSSGHFSHTYTAKGMFFATCIITDNIGNKINSNSLRIGSLHIPTNFDTIQDAINASLDGDEIVVQDGTYIGKKNKSIQFGGKAITLTSENGPSGCIIDCENDGRGFLFNGGEQKNAVLTGFTIINGTPPEGSSSGGGAIQCINSSPTISNCVIKNNSCDQGGAISCADHASPDILNCELIKNSAGYGGAISCVDSSSPIITNCLIAGNSAQYGAEIYCERNCSIKITNSTLTMNSAINYSGGILKTPDSYITIVNSILWRNMPNEYDYKNPEGIKITHSTIRGGWDDEGNSDIIPLFKDSKNGDYRLSDYSFCIGAGLEDEAPETDIEGNSRPNPFGSNPDKGAYENSLAVRHIPPPDNYGMDLGNINRYEYGSNILIRQVANIDETTFPVETYVIYEYLEDSSDIKINWYERDSDGVKLWGMGTQGDDEFYGFSNGLVYLWIDMKVGDKKTSTATVTIAYNDYNVILNAEVKAKEIIQFEFGEFNAYKINYELRIWNNFAEYNYQSTEWVVPYLGTVKADIDNIEAKLIEFEIGSGTLDRHKDSDADGLYDFMELSVYGTNRLTVDTESDGMPDKWEVENDLNPLVNDSFSDEDNDGLDNLGEYQNGTKLNSSDSDNDRIPDGWEVNNALNPLLNDSNLDPDHDNLSNYKEYENNTNPFNSDTDSDGMPDAWEVYYHLNPVQNDGALDTDGDGFSNLDEYIMGRHPGSSEPATPMLISPADGSENISLTPELKADAFSDGDMGDFHGATRWQISTDESFSSEFLVLDMTSELHLTSLLVPEFGLSADVIYYWRVKYVDSQEAESEWSEMATFNTIRSDENDQNGDGIPDDQEVNDSAVDLDHDGTADILQSNIKCINAINGSGEVSVKSGTNITSIVAAKSISPDNISDNTDKPTDMACGLISFKLTVENIGDVGEVTIYLSSAASTDSKWFKYDMMDGWQDYSSHATFSADRTAVTLLLKDGGFGDADGVSNGVIIDPSGLGVVPSSNSSSQGGGGGGGGCFIDSLVQ